MRIALPGINRDSVVAFLSRNPESFLHTYDVYAGGALSRPTLFAFGITPYIAGAVLVLLMSGVVPYLRRLREGDRRANLDFDRWIHVVTAALAAFQGWGLAIFLETIPAASGVLATGLGFRAVIMATITAATMLLVWIAHQVTWHGVTNGIVVLILADLVFTATSGIRIEVRAIAAGIQTPSVLLALVVISWALVAAALAAVRAKRYVAVARVDGAPQASEEPDSNRSVALRTNTAGVIPILTASVLTFPLQALGITSGSIGYWTAYCASTLVFVYLWTAITFSSRDFIVRLKAYGYRISQADTDEEAAAHVDSILERAIIPYALLLVGLAVAPVLLSSWLNLNGQLSSVLGPPLLVAAATAVAITEAAAVRRTIEEPTTNAHVPDPAPRWSPVFRSETELDVEMVRALLDGAGIASARFSNRAISVTGTLAFWESARPSLPSLTVYRRLGGGEVYALVPPERVDDALRVLHSRSIVSP